MNRLRAACALWAALVGLALGCGCSGPAAPGEQAGDFGGDDIVVYDFARDLAVAEVAWERSRLRVGDPDFVRRLGDGWGALETDANGVSFRWTLGRRAELDVFVARPRDVTLVCRCDTFSWPDGPPQKLTVEVGDHRSETVGVADESSGKTGAEIFLPAGIWRPGWNRVTLEASRATPPAEVAEENDDVRPLALRVEALEFRGLLDSAAPTADDGVLRLPAGASVTSFGESAGQSWAIGDVETRGNARLGVYLHARDERLPLNPGPFAVSNDVSIGEPVAVTLVAEPVDPSWWQGLSWKQSGGEAAEVAVRGGRVLLSAEKMPSRVAPDHEAAERDAEVDVDATHSGVAGVIVYMIDTLRADRLGAYGSEQGLTPHLDALAQESVVFTEARAQSSWTRPSVVSTFTGFYPQRHAVDDRDEGLAASVDTLAELLFAAGTDTAGIVTNGNISHEFGIGQGFAHYRHLPETSEREGYHVLADELNAWGLHWLDTHQRERPDQPFFLYLHATDPHAPYTPREPFAARFAPDADAALGRLDFVERLRDGGPAEPDVREQLLALYDAEVAWTDAQLGKFFEALRERDLWRDTMVIVVSDHGEEFFDHGGWEHGHTLYDEQLLVPLLVKLPEGKLPEGVGTPRRVEGPAGHVDVMPTILDALGVEYDASTLDGRSLWPALVGTSERSTGAPPLGHLELSDLSLRSLVVGPWKVIEDLNRGRGELFDLPSDPAEQTDLAPSRPLRSGVLGQERRRLEQGLDAESADEVELDEETRKQLEALGYAG